MKGVARAPRPGVTLPELLLVAWLFGLVLLGLARFATVQGRLAAISQDRVRAADVVRTVDVVLNRELRHSAATDRILTGDSIRLRAVRGIGAVCGAAGSDIRVAYVGVRRPDPTKDSALLISTSDTRGSAHGIAAVSADTACGGGYRLSVDPPPPERMGLALVYEAGSYHLSGGALRYRRGRGGRQPVTEAVLGGGRFVMAPGRVEARLSLTADSLPGLSRYQAAVVVRLLNPVLP